MQDFIQVGVDFAVKNSTNSTIDREMRETVDELVKAFIRPAIERGYQRARSVVERLFSRSGDWHRKEEKGKKGQDGVRETHLSDAQATTGQSVHFKVVRVD